MPTSSPPLPLCRFYSFTPSSSILQYPNLKPSYSNHHSLVGVPRMPHRRRNRAAAVFVAMSGELEDPSQKPTKLVTFLGKGGSGKTTSAVLVAQYHAKEGLRTCLVLHSQDSTAEHLIGCKIGHSPSMCTQNLSVMRVETTKMLLEPLVQMKKADAQINLTQGILDGVVGEELGILPGMDSIFSALALEKLINFLGTKKKLTKGFGCCCI